MPEWTKIYCIQPLNVLTELQNAELMVFWGTISLFFELQSVLLFLLYLFEILFTLDKSCLKSTTVDCGSVHGLHCLFPVDTRRRLNVVCLLGLMVLNKYFLIERGQSPVLLKCCKGIGCDISLYLPMINKARELYSFTQHLSLKERKFTVFQFFHLSSDWYD